MKTKTLGQIAYEAFAERNDWQEVPEEYQEGFERAAQAVIEAYESRKWQPIESATDNLSLIYTSNNEVTVAIRDIKNDEWFDMLGESNDDGENLLPCDPTHWQPLPAPPKKEKNNGTNPQRL